MRLGNPLVHSAECGKPSSVILGWGLKSYIMRITFWLAFLGVFLGAELQAGTIQYQVSDLGGNAHRYTYSISGFSLQANQEVDIRFDAALYGVLSNGVAGAGFDLLLVQPNIPPGTPGDYSALALVNNPSLTGPFSVDFTYLGQGLPGAQPYFINQYDAAGNLVSTSVSSMTTSVGGAPVPEPATCVLAGLGLLAGGAFRTMRRRSGR